MGGVEVREETIAKTLTFSLSDVKPAEGFELRKAVI